MFKKLASLLFEEEEEILEETRLDEEPKAKKSLSIFETKTKKVPVEEPDLKKPSLIAQMNPELSSEETVVEKAPLSEAQIRSNFGLTVDEPEDLDDFVTPHESSKPIQVSTKHENPRKIYEFHPVISPIFGVSESLQKDTSPRVLFEEAPTLPKSVINTVISPIYGDMDNSKSVVKTHSIEPKMDIKTEPKAPVINTKPEDRVKPFEFETPEPKQSMDIEVDETVDFESLDLEDLIKSSTPKIESIYKEPVHDETDDDAHQFSLFDDVK